MMTSQILKFVDFKETQKSRHLENETLFILQIKKFINYTSRATLWQKNTFAVEVTFNESKLGSSILNTEDNINDYDLIIIRMDHSRRTGGVACYIRKFISYDY